MTYPSTPRTPSEPRNRVPTPLHVGPRVPLSCALADHYRTTPRPPNFPASSILTRVGGVYGVVGSPAYFLLVSSPVCVASLVPSVPSSSGFVKRFTFRLRWVPLHTHVRTTTERPRTCTVPGRGFCCCPVPSSDLRGALTVEVNKKHIVSCVAVG